MYTRYKKENWKQIRINTLRAWRGKEKSGVNASRETIKMQLRCIWQRDRREESVRTSIELDAWSIAACGLLMETERQAERTVVPLCDSERVGQCNFRVCVKINLCAWMDTKRYTFEDKEEIILADISFLFFFFSVRRDTGGEGKIMKLEGNLGRVNEEERRRHVNTVVNMAHLFS